MQANPETMAELKEALPLINREIRIREKMIPAYQINYIYHVICVLLIIAFTIFDIAINIDLYRAIFADEYKETTSAQEWLIIIKSLSYLSAILFMKLLAAQMYKRSDEIFIVQHGRSEQVWQGVTLALYIVGFLISLYAVYHIGRAASLVYISEAIVVNESGVYSQEAFINDASKIALLLPLSALGISVLWATIEYQIHYRKPMRDHLIAERNELQSYNDLIAEYHQLELEAIKCSSKPHIQAKATEGFNYCIEPYKEELFEGSATNLFSHDHAGVEATPDIVEGIDIKTPHEMRVFTNAEKLEEKTERCKQSIELAYQYLNFYISRLPTLVHRSSTNEL